MLRNRTLTLALARLSLSGFAGDGESILPRPREKVARLRATAETSRTGTIGACRRRYKHANGNEKASLT